jgi:hypothetical protein
MLRKIFFSPEAIKARKELEKNMEVQKEEINRKRYEEDFQKRRIAEKQIRALRRNYRAQSFLQQNTQPDMTNKLGG